MATDATHSSSIGVVDNAVDETSQTILLGRSYVAQVEVIVEWVESGGQQSHWLVELFGDKLLHRHATDTLHNITQKHEAEVAVYHRSISIELTLGYEQQNAVVVGGLLP